jgi:hypothetical protein
MPPSKALASAAFLVAKYEKEYGYASGESTKAAFTGPPGRASKTLRFPMTANTSSSDDKDLTWMCSAQFGFGILFAESTRSVLT